MEEKQDSLLSGVKEIARRAKVSRATVDRVIHNRPGVSVKTKNRINAIIKELDYQPNVLAQRLALTSRGIIRLAVLLPDISEETEYWKAPLEGINKAEAEIKQYGLQVDYYFFDQNVQSVFALQVQQIMENNPDGVLITPTFEPDSIRLLEYCKTKKIPCVLMNSDIAGQHRLCYIGPELFDSGYLSAQLVHYCLKDQQKVMIVNIAREIENNAAILVKEEGFLAYFKEKLSERLLVALNTTDTRHHAVAARLNELLELESHIGVIYVTNSRVSLVAQWLESIGRSDIILIGYDYLAQNIEFLKRGVIDFLLCEKPQEQGYRSVMTLFQFLVFGTLVKEDYLIPIDIITSANYRYYRN
ncbi:LacI family DNA-binding transcriptional regulator [Dyadobacter psychrotolerans]|uniref:LacI family DNA-binding transcriptional regulator n=1 Tax=Dyadobacter psychrotolerans TaxID=2541721 RepID=A0A4R5DSY5_9BACT|nr:substrate-binding domain-containing protein [Dyadobacter psychrotolerans]TDE15211.1 LacI family DNA-binding transcriptional regulator [Dyadobacter psychrotolerans]